MASSSSAARRRTVSSAAAARPHLLAEIKPLLDSLETSAADPDILVRLQWLSLLKRVLVDSPEAKDTFRVLKGFQALVSALHSFSGFYSSSSRTDEEKHHFIELLKCLFGVVSEALLNHPGNKRFFARRIGWDSIEQGLAATGLPTEAPDQGFGVLLSFALDDATLSSLIVSIKRVLAQHEKRTPWSEPEKSEQRGKFLRQRTGYLFGPEVILLNPEIVPSILNFLTAMPRTSDSEVTAVIVLQTLLSVASASKFNVVAMHSTGVLSYILTRLWDQSVPSSERVVLLDLARCLVTLGVNCSYDARELFKKAMVDDGAAAFLLEAIKTSQEPPHVQFDLSLHGYASMELSTLGRPFPPTSTHGYTFSAWVCVGSFDPKAHTTIFGAFDVAQRCFILAYIEQETRKFILQTSVASPRASVRFKSTVFETKKWYHIALVHRRSRATSSAKAALYVDGEFVEEVKVAYPCSPATPATPVQVFLGTPVGLSPRLGRGVVSSKWSVGTAHLFEDVLSDDLIAVYYRLGPRYFGNFQDALGSFQTYEASSALNMRNELMHPGRQESSDIMTAIRKASGILPESKVMLNLSATQVLDDRDENSIDESQLIKLLSKNASRNLQNLTRAGAVAINGAVPSINEALQVSHGFAVMTGEPIVVVPQSLDDVAWRIGGAASIGLKMVELAKSPQQVCRAVAILFEMVKNSWRNSDVMERENGFAVLGHLIRQKEAKGVVGKELLRLILDFVGYSHEKPEESFIINALAYRILLVDVDVWRKADLETQREYFQQFTTFTSGSKFHHFNSRRLIRMRIVRKLLFALKSEVFSREILPDFLAAFKTLVKANMSADVLRSLALFITYTLHKQKSTRPLNQKKSNIQLRGAAAYGPSPRPRSISQVYADGDAVAERGAFTRQQIGLMVLKMYHDLLCESEAGTANLKKFARTVTNKVPEERWLLYLLAENDPQIVILATKILARLLVVHGSSYVSKFINKTGGFIIMRNRLKRWWHLPQLWSICFCIFFGKDIARIDVDKPLDLPTLIEKFSDGGKAKGVYPEVLPVIASMLKAGLTSVVMDHCPEPVIGNGKGNSLDLSSSHTRRRSFSLNDQALAQVENTPKKQTPEMAKMLHSVVQFFADLQSRSPGFRDFCSTSPFTREMLGILFPVICSSDHVSAETELNSRDSALTFDGGDVVIRPLSSNAMTPPIVRTVTVEDRPVTPNGIRSERLRRGSSFILVTSEPTEYSPSSARLKTGLGADAHAAGRTGAGVHATTNTVVESLLELVMTVFLDLVLERRDFNGFNLNTKIPPGFQEHQIYFETYLLRNTTTHLGSWLGRNTKRLQDTRVLTNVARFALYATDGIFEGWFLNGAEVTLDFVGQALEYLQQPHIACLKNVRLCSQSVTNLRTAVSRLVLFRLSELDDPKTAPKEVVDFLAKMMYWQTVILSPENTDGEFTRLIFYLLYTRLIDQRENIRLAAADMLRIVLVQKPEETSLLLDQAKSVDHKQLSSGFGKLLQMENETWLYWVDDHRTELDAFFCGALSKSWDSFVAEENRRTQETAKKRLSKRKEKLKVWISEELANDTTYGRHESSFIHWTANIFASEQLKFQRTLQDQQDNANFIVAQYAKLEADLTRPQGLLDDGQEVKWRLDLTEGRNRMRKRILPDRRGHLHNYQPKRRLTGGPNGNLALRPHTLSVDGDELSITTNKDGDSINEQQQMNVGRNGADDDEDDDYELVDDPRERDDEDGWEDKNRKVMRSLEHGDIVEFVYNVSRLVGLDAVEGLLILGKNCLYLMDNFFQRSDGEIVNVWQAPKDERDQYLQLISGRESNDKKPAMSELDHETRHWPFEDLISISKRRFLFRDVALELFFVDGRSYLLTTMSVKDRDALHARLLPKATSVSGNSPSPWIGEAWKTEAVKTPDHISNFGSKIANVFTSGNQNPHTKRWIKGEISNFHYLMLVNTMAGRTFNDLTQYPVFPWVLADYTSEELDLTNPRTFRDLSKPMGAQTPERQQEFRERYKAFEDLNDGPAFHYGTHYSSAMIVCSYLIRLQPFVQSYLLLQGGQFDHADRLFDSIGKTWMSASRENSSDVRELIPEFFFLPEFLMNSNGYNFGLKQGSDECINHVVLPPWAKGDPKVFIAKNREALESPYVSQHLHEWIDLVFGFKQRGEAAIEATNTFHHLSYRGATDLDSIEDQVERVATINIIHNFGQTPNQVYTRPHPPRDITNVSTKARLDADAESLIRLPFPLLDSRERVSSLYYSTPSEKVHAAGTFRLNIPPSYERFMEWGFADASVRFYQTESKKICGHYEHLHQGQLSCARFADPKTLITAGTDGTVSVWQVSLHGKQVGLELRTPLFGHLMPVVVMAISRSFSTLVTTSNDRTVIVWDLNRLRFVRQLKASAPVQFAAVNDVTGDIVLCCGAEMTIYTLNGQKIISQNLCTTADDVIVSCACYEGVGNEWLERDLIFTGHKRGMMKIWNKAVRGGRFVLELVKEFQHTNQFQHEITVSASITCILPMPHAVITGDEQGRVYQWDCQIVTRSQSPVLTR